MQKAAGACGHRMTAAPRDRRATVRDAADNSVAVEVLIGCRSLESLQRVHKAVIARDWHAQARSLNIAVSIDAAQGRVLVELPLAAKDEAAELRQRFGAAVSTTFVDMAPAAGTRAADYSPHYGGARITGGCSTGFAVAKPDGGWHHVTAGHCGSTGEKKYSGTYVYGILGSKWAPPDADLALLSGGEQQYSRAIYMNPVESSPRYITEKQQSYLGMPPVARTRPLAARANVGWPPAMGRLGSPRLGPASRQRGPTVVTLVSDIWRRVDG